MIDAPLRPGWLKRQLDHVTKDIATWPAWMRRESGLEDMSDEKKLKQPVRPGLSELAPMIAELAEEILRCTETRKAVIGVLQGHVEPPTLILSYPSEPGAQPETFEFKMGDMPTELVETILQCVVAHVEAATLELWPRVYDLAANAVANVKKIKQEAAEREKRDGDEGTPIIKFPDSDKGEHVEP